MLQPPAAPRFGAAIRIERITKSFGPVTAVDDVSLDIAAGEFIALLGPSGSGKTSILMSLAGFDFPSRGRITMGERDVTYLPANRRNLGMVFQKYTLFPHMSVRDNVAFPLKMRGVSRQERRRRADSALETVRLSGFGDRAPAQLSGGQQQRVALARAIVYEPQVLLMDEPLSALDKHLREEMQLEIKRIHGELGMTVLFVTHDQSEALHMADRIAVLKDGRIQQLGTPAQLYSAPANLFVAGFMGDMNFLPGKVSAGSDAANAQVDIGAGRIWTIPAERLAEPVRPGDDVVLAVRPEQLALTHADNSLALRAQLVDRVFSGPSCLFLARTESGRELRLWSPADGEGAALRNGDTLHIAPKTDGVRLYAKAAP